MEENQNVNENQIPPKKKMGKKKKVIIGVVAVLLVAIITVVVLALTGVINFNLSDKAKADAGISKVSEVITGTVNDLETELTEAGLDAKALSNLSPEEVEAAVNVSLDIKELTIDGLEDEQDLVDDVVALLNDVKLNASLKGTEDGKLNVKIGGEIAEAPISAEVTYDGEVVGMRAEELNEKWIGLDAQTVIDAMSEEFSEEDLAELEAMADEFVAFAEDFVLTEEEIEHFKSTYSKTLTEYLLFLEIKPEKDEVSVGGTNKKCTKTTITLDEDDIKDLLITYIEKVENDEKGQEIVKEKIKLLCNFIIENEELFEVSSIYDDPYSYYDDYDYDYDYDDYDYDYDDYELELNDTDYYYESPSIAETMQEVLDNVDVVFEAETIDMIKEGIEELDLGDFEVKIETYASLTEVYATKIIFDVDGAGLVVDMKFDGNRTDALVSVKAGQKMDVLEIVLVNEKNHKSLEVKAAKDIVEYIGTEVSAKAECTIAENNLKTVLTLDMGEEGNLTFEQDLTVETNTETEYKAKTANRIKAEIPYAFTCDLTVNVDLLYKTSGVTVDKIEDYIDLTDAVMSGEEPDEATIEELKTYVEDAIPNVVKILEALNEVEVINENVGDDLETIISELENASFEDLMMM